MPFDFDLKTPGRRAYGSYQVLQLQKMHDRDCRHTSLCVPQVQWRVEPIFVKGCLDSPVFVSCRHSW